MNYLIMLFIGSSLGYFSYYYLSHFRKRIIRELQDNCEEILQFSTPHFAEKNINLKSVQYFSIKYFLIIFSLAQLCIYFFTQNILVSLIIGNILTLLVILSIVDFHYQFLPLELTQFLLFMGLICGYYQVFTIDLIQSFESAVLSFCIFFSFYFLTKFWFKKEVFGQGDYWLIAALMSFHNIEILPLMICIASCSALLFIITQKLLFKKSSSIQSFIPFGPFLCMGFIIVSLYQIC